jgi:hypothetical protein
MFGCLADFFEAVCPSFKWRDQRHEQLLPCYIDKQVWSTEVLSWPGSLAVVELGLDPKFQKRIYM